MIDKRRDNVDATVASVKDGATVLISDFGEAGSPVELIHALRDHGATDLTIVSNNACNGHVELAALIEVQRVAKDICSFPKNFQSDVFEEVYKAGDIELELVPRGTLAERIRAGGAGIPAFYTPTSVSTPLEDGKEIREFNGHAFVLETGITGDFSLIKANRADGWGNLTYSMTARNSGPIMCMAAETTTVQVRSIVPLGELDPESIVTPAIFVNQTVELSDPVEETQLIREGVIRSPR